MSFWLAIPIFVTASLVFTFCGSYLRAKGKPLNRLVVSAATLTGVAGILFFGTLFFYCLKGLGIVFWTTFSSKALSWETIWRAFVFGQVSELLVLAITLLMAYLGLELSEYSESSLEYQARYPQMKKK